MPAALTLPFAPIGPFTPETRAAIQRAAERANDRYLAEFLEKDNYCPFARKGRKSGSTDRFFHLAESTDLEPVFDYFEHAAANDALEVVQVIFPLLDAPPEEFAAFVQEATRVGNARVGGPDVFAPAAMHPRLPFCSESSLAIIPLFRRTPDPTIQWTRNTTLNAIYDGRRGGKTFVDVADIEALLKRPPPRDLYDEISHANHNRALKAPVDAIETLLAGLFRAAQDDYQRILTTEV